MAVSYKQLCRRCRKNFVVVCGRQEFAVCYHCQKSELNGSIKDPKMKKMFNIPEEYYMQNSFLRSIKLNYFRYENLTEKQVTAFKKTVADLKSNKKSAIQA